MSEQDKMDEAIDELLKEFVRLFKDRIPQNATLLLAKKHLSEERAANPEGFLAAIHWIAHTFSDKWSICKVVSDMGAEKAKLAASSLPTPLRKIVEEAIFLWECENLREIIAKAISPLSRNKEDE